MQINKMHVWEKPMEKMQLQGKEALTDAELFAIIFRAGTRTINAVGLAEQMLRRNLNESPLVSLYEEALLE